MKLAHLLQFREGLPMAMKLACTGECGAARFLAPGITIPLSEAHLHAGPWGQPWFLVDGDMFAVDEEGNVAWLREETPESLATRAKGMLS